MHCSDTVSMAAHSSKELASAGDDICVGRSKEHQFNKMVPFQRTLAMDIHGRL